MPAAEPHRLDKAFAQYLERYAHRDTRTIAGLGLNYDRTLVVPAFGEAPSFIAGFTDARQGAPGRTLLILVVNEPETADAVDRAQNQALLEAVTRGPCQRLSKTVQLAHSAQGDVLVVDRTGSDALPRRQAVGLARKIGADLACALIYSGQVRSRWVYTTDADAVLPRDYFSTPADPRSAALCFPFEHVRAHDDAAYLATLAHELRLRYQVLGLAWAGSAYAWHSIGSTIAVRADAYAAARGFPKRAAGEDFHLLQKVSKLGLIETASCEPIQLQARLSDRVPYGTGPAARELMANTKLLLESPRSFDALSRWLRWLFEAPPHAYEPASFLQQRPPPEHSAFDAFLRKTSFHIAALTCRRQAPTQANYVMREWFDGLRCQQLLHSLRSVYPQLTWDQALNEAPFVGNQESSVSAKNESIEAVVLRLRRQEALLPCLRGPLVV